MGEDLSKLEDAKRRFDAAFKKFRTKEDAIPRGERKYWHLSNVTNATISFQRTGEKAEEGRPKTFSILPPLTLDGMDLFKFKEYVNEEAQRLKFKDFTLNIMLPRGTYEKLFHGNNEQKEESFQLIVERVKKLASNEKIVFKNLEEAEEYTKKVISRAFNFSDIGTLKLPAWLTVLLGAEDPLEILRSEELQGEFKLLTFDKFFGQNLSTFINKAFVSLNTNKNGHAAEATNYPNRFWKHQAEQEVFVQTLNLPLAKVIQYLEHKLLSSPDRAKKDIRTDIRAMSILQLELENPDLSNKQLAKKLQEVESSKKPMCTEGARKLLGRAHALLEEELNTTSVAKRFPDLATFIESHCRKR